MDHLDNEVPLPKQIPLTDGQFEVGREDSAQLTIRLPTVSARHAILRVGVSIPSTALVCDRYTLHNAM